VTLSPINSGSTLFKPVARGARTFLPPDRYPDAWWRARRVAELAVDYGVPDIVDLALRVTEWQGTDELRVLWMP
jgi:hypothetical protein